MSNPNVTNEPRQLPFSVVFVPTLLFGVLSLLSHSVWPGVEQSGRGYIVLTCSFGLPLLVLSARPSRRTSRQYSAILAGGIASSLLLLQTDLGVEVVNCPLQ